MHIFIIFLHEAFIDSIAEIAYFFFIYFIFVGSFFWNIYELVSAGIKILLLILFISLSSFLRSFRFDWFLIKILRLIHTSLLIYFGLYRLNYWWSQSFYKRSKCIVSNLSCYHCE